MTDGSHDTGGPAALLTVTATGGAPTLHEAARLLSMPVGDLDAEFGVVAIDRERSLYAVRTTAEGAASRSGAFSDPKIEGFGPE